MTNGYILILGEKIKVEDVKPSTTLFAQTKLDLIMRSQKKNISKTQKTLSIERLLE